MPMLRERLSTRRGPRLGGFTLIELIVVIVIVGIMAIVAIPQMSIANDSRESAAARQLLRDVSFARERAMLTGNRSWVVFDGAAETYSILAEDPLAPGRIGATVLSDPATGREFIVKLDVDELAGVRITSATFDGAAEVGFDWLGQPLNNTESPLTVQGSVVLTGGGGIIVKSGTGVIDYVP